MGSSTEIETEKICLCKHISNYLKHKRQYLHVIKNSELLTEKLSNINEILSPGYLSLLYSQFVFAFQRTENES